MKALYVLFAGFLAVLTLFGTAQAQTPGAAPGANGHIINLTDVDIQTLIDDVSVITGYTFVTHPDVRANVTVTSQVPMSTREVFQVFLSTLRVNGYSAVPLGKDFYSIVPEVIAAQDGSASVRDNNNFATEVFRLDHFSAVEAAKMIKPLLGPLGQVTASPASNALIVVEYGSNLGRVRSLIQQIDEDQSVTETVALKSVPAAEMQEIIQNLTNGGNDSNARGQSSFSALAAEASNSLILRGAPDQVTRAKALIYQLDTRSGLERETRVIRLSHTEAASILPILQEVAAGNNAEGGPNSGPTASIALHEPSNSLIVSATPETLAALSRVAVELDARRKQVLVEAIIVEVSDTAARELGVQFVVAGQNGNVPFGSSTFPGGAGGDGIVPNLLALTGALASSETTDAFGAAGSGILETAATSALLGLTGGTVGFGTERNGTLFSVVLNALQEDTESNVLSTPSIMALNNQTALVSVGQEIPISSGQVLGDANLNPFQTTERREIGIILNVTPRIGEDGTIRLDINQEVSSIAATVGAATPDFILNQSQLETSVIADDGQMIVLGGLIQVEDVINQQKVPVLGDLPGIGRLFRAEETSQETTNLMVFIRPTIVGDAAQAREATQRSYNYIRAQQIIANDGGPAAIDQFVDEVFEGRLPEFPTPQSPDGGG